ncbi:glutaredoxin [Imleria badia]|nr:glutaredoxin [Imleria badia]
MPSVKEFVDDKIANNGIVVFSKSWCPYCAETKRYFTTKYPEETVEVVELDSRNDGDDIQDYLKNKTGARSVPRTFINGKSVGGNSDLQAMSKSEVDALIAKRS